MDLVSGHKSNQNTQVHVIFYSDVHGRFLSENTSETGKQSTGIDRLSTYIKQLKRRTENVLIIDNGDSIQGTPLVDLHDFIAPGLENLNHPLNIIHDKIGVNCFIVGNHEFNFGMKQIALIRKQSKATWLGANVYSKLTEECYFEPYRIFNFDNIKVGVLGLVTEYVSRWENREHINGLEFRNVVETCGTFIKDVRKKCDILIVAYHGGLKRNPENDERWTVVDNNENQGLELWSLYPEIDLLLTGHQHRSLLYAPEDNKAIVIQPSCYGRQWAHIVVEKEDNHLSEQKPSIKSDLIDAVNYEPDMEVCKSMGPHLEHCENILDTFLGTADDSFLIKDPMKDVWLKKHPYIQWINDLMCEITGVDISGIPLLDANLKGFSGEVRIKDILKNFIFQDNVCILQINGSILRSALEKTADFFYLNSNENGGKTIEINKNWKRGKILSYNYDIWNGIEYGFNISKSPGNRLSWLKYHGNEVKGNDVLNIAVTSYRSGGAFYTMFTPDLIVQNFPAKITDLMINDIIEKKHLTVKPIENFKVFF